MERVDGFLSKARKAIGSTFSITALKKGWRDIGLFRSANTRFVNEPFTVLSRHNKVDVDLVVDYKIDHQKMKMPKLQNGTQACKQGFDDGCEGRSDVFVVTIYGNDVQFKPVNDLNNVHISHKSGKYKLYERIDHAEEGDRNKAQRHEKECVFISTTESTDGKYKILGSSNEDIKIHLTANVHLLPLSVSKDGNTSWIKSIFRFPIMFFTKVIAVVVTSIGYIFVIPELLFKKLGNYLCNSEFETRNQLDKCNSPVQDKEQNNSRRLAGKFCLLMSRIFKVPKEFTIFIAQSFIHLVNLAISVIGFSPSGDLLGAKIVAKGSVKAIRGAGKDFIGSVRAVAHPDIDVREVRKNSFMKAQESSHIFKANIFSKVLEGAANKHHTEKEVLSDGKKKDGITKAVHSFFTGKGKEESTDHSGLGEVVREFSALCSAGILSPGDDNGERKIITAVHEVVLSSECVLDRGI